MEGISKTEEESWRLLMNGGDGRARVTAHLAASPVDKRRGATKEVGREVKDL